MGFLVLVLTQVFVSDIIVGLNSLPVYVFIPLLFVFFFSVIISTGFTVCFFTSLVTDSTLFCWLFAIHDRQFIKSVFFFQTHGTIKVSAGCSISLINNRMVRESLGPLGPGPRCGTPLSRVFHSPAAPLHAKRAL